MHLIYKNNSFLEEQKAKDRSTILNMVSKYVGKYGEGSISNNKYLPVTGKLIDDKEIVNSVDACLDMWFTSSRYNKKFEKEISKFLGVKYFLTCNSGSSANLLAVSALCSHQLGDKAMKKGDEVITCATGFPTTINPIIQNGLVPVFIDAKLNNYNINEKLIEGAITKKTKAIFIAHALGNPFDLKEISLIAKKYNLYLIEDCCDALGSTYDNKMVGSFGDISTLSFYPAHHITMGEGGGVFCKSSKLKMILQSIRDWGRDCWCDAGCDNTCKKRYDWKLGNLPYGYDHKYTYSNLGYNLKITDMQAAIGLAQLNKLDFFIRKRRENFDYLKRSIKCLNKFLILPKATKNSNPSWFGFPITLNKGIDRNKVVKYLEENGVGTRLLFAGNITKQPYLKKYKYKVHKTLKISDIIMERTFWIGVHPSLKKENINKICLLLIKYFEK